MMTLIYILLYVLGCVLAYGRFKAQSVEYKELCGIEFPFDCVDWFFICMSWLMFIGTVVTYYRDKDKYFFKF